MPCKVGTIHQIHRQLIDNGYHVSECALRRWIKAGALPAVYTGNKALISYEKVVALLDNPPVAPLTA